MARGSGSLGFLRGKWAAVLGMAGAKRRPYAFQLPYHCSKCKAQPANNVTSFLDSSLSNNLRSRRRIEIWPTTLALMCLESMSFRSLRCMQTQKWEAAVLRRKIAAYLVPWEIKGHDHYLAVSDRHSLQCLSRRTVDSTMRIGSSCLCRYLRLN